MKPVDDRAADYRAFVAHGYDACGAAYDADRAASAGAVLDPLMERLPDRARVLDLGCGAGVPIARTLAGRFDVIGADISRQQTMLAHHAVPTAGIVTADMSAWPFRSDVFDAVVSFYAIFHEP